MNTVATRIYELICEDKISQKELAAKVGITEVSISRYMHGERAPRPDILGLIAKALGTSTDYLLGRTDDKMETIYEGDQISKELQALGVKMFSVLGDDLSDVELDEVKKFAEYIRSKRDT